MVRESDRNPGDELRVLTSSSIIEIYPSAKILEKLKSYPPIDELAISCSPAKGIETTLRMAVEAKKLGFKVVPHISARSVKDKNHVREIGAFLGENGLNEVFIIGGDIESPAGEFDSAVKFMRALFEISDVKINKVGVAAYPEKHDKIGDEALKEAIFAKEELAKNKGFEIYCETQMCFSAKAILDWIRQSRRNGLRMQAIVGIPGAGNGVEIANHALECGVGESLRILELQIGREIGKKYLFGYTPDSMLRELVEKSTEADQITGLRIFSFNMPTALAWQASKLS